MSPFRKRHILAILSMSETSRLPLDAYLRLYFKENKSIGATDRRVICEAVYHTIRWRGLIDHVAKRPLTWEHRLDVPFPPPLSDKPPAHIEVSFPKWLYERIDDHATCLASNGQAPVTLRANPLKTTREALLEKMPEAAPCQTAPHGLIYPKRANFFGMELFKAGLFEIQDEASQLIATLVDPKPGDHVLDYCCGSGGKTLAFAHKLEGKGQLYLHDVRPHVLTEAKKRLKRAGVQNWTVAKRLKEESMDWILLDVPCSGTGTLRRNPDMKWRLTPEAIERLVKVQREIIDETVQFLKPGGHIVYATCSLLNEENGDQAAYMTERHGLMPIGCPFASKPTSGGMDGFFGAVFVKM